MKIFQVTRVQVSLLTKSGEWRHLGVGEVGSLRGPPPLA